MDSALPKVDKPTHEQKRPPTTSELISSAKLVAGAAQSSFGNEKDKVDKVKVAGAADDLLQAASKYGKLEEKGLGQYVDKADNYLHQYSSNSKPTTAAGSDHPAPVDKKESPAPPSSGDGGGDKSESGVGGAFKMAQGFFK